jgi:hypothetical protein
MGDNEAQAAGEGKESGMKQSWAVLAVRAAAAIAGERPKTGKVEIFRLADVKPGMKAVAWTTFTGIEPEEVPIEIIGVWKNAFGPRQDVILGKMGGKAERTNVAGGMSGSPVYIDGKLAGAVSLRLSVFSPDAICGITPIDLMLEIQEFDDTKPSDSRTPDRAAARRAAPLPGELLARVAGAGLGAAADPLPWLTPIETPLVFSGFSERVLREFDPFFRQMGLRAVQGGGGAGAAGSPKPAPGWESALKPGEPVSGVLVSGDMSVTGMGTVTYNDGKRVLAFGHPFFNLGPVSMPMAKAEVLMVLASSFQPNKFGNATDIVGALKQDRHAGILGELGAAAEMIPVDVTVRSWNGDNKVRKEKKLHFNVFVHQKWTPYLMMVTMFNSLEGLNDHADDTTYRLSGNVEVNGAAPLSITTMLAPSDAPAPPAMTLAGWWADRFNRLFANATAMPQVKRVNAVVDLLPERRQAAIANAWVADSEVRAGEEIPVTVFLRPYRGETMQRTVTVRIPPDFPKGQHRILVSDAETLNRMQTVAGLVNRAALGLSQTVSLLNQERSNHRLFVSLVENQPTAYVEDKELPSLPASVQNVLQTGRSATANLARSPETAREMAAVPFEFVVSGSQFLRINVK